MLYTASYFQPENHHGQLLSVSRSRPQNFRSIKTLHFFTPSQDLLKFWKDKSKTAQLEELPKLWEQYQDGFFDLLDERIDQIHSWTSALKYEDYTLLCWEKAGEYCHRNDVGELLAARCAHLWGGFDQPLSELERMILRANQQGHKLRTQRIDIFYQLYEGRKDLGLWTEDGVKGAIAQVLNPTQPEKWQERLAGGKL